MPVVRKLSRCIVGALLFILAGCVAVPEGHCQRDLCEECSLGAISVDGRYCVIHAQLHRIDVNRCQTCGAMITRTPAVCTLENVQLDSVCILPFTLRRDSIHYVVSGFPTCPAHMSDRIMFNTDGPLPVPMPSPLDDPPDV